MKQMILLLLLSAFLGCGSSEIVRIGPNLYMINGSTAFTSSKVKTEMLIKANKFAEERGKIAEKVNLREEHPAVGTGGHYEYQFRLVDTEK